MKSCTVLTFELNHILDFLQVLPMWSFFFLVQQLVDAVGILCISCCHISSDSVQVQLDFHLFLVSNDIGICMHNRNCVVYFAHLVSLEPIASGCILSCHRRGETHWAHFLCCICTGRTILSLVPAFRLLPPRSSAVLLFVTNTMTEYIRRGRIWLDIFQILWRSAICHPLYTNHLFLSYMLGRSSCHFQSGHFYSQFWSPLVLLPSPVYSM